MPSETSKPVSRALAASDFQSCVTSRAAFVSIPTVFLSNFEVLPPFIISEIPIAASGILMAALSAVTAPSLMRSPIPYSTFSALRQSNEFAFFWMSDVLAVFAAELDALLND